MPEFPIPSARILLVSQIQGERLPPAPLSGTPMTENTGIFKPHVLTSHSTDMATIVYITSVTDERIDRRTDVRTSYSDVTISRFALRALRRKNDSIQ